LVLENFYELNILYPDFYRCAQPAMINDWRQRFEDSSRISFFFVQVAIVVVVTVIIITTVIVAIVITTTVVTTVIVATVITTVVVAIVVVVTITITATAVTTAIVAIVVVITVTTIATTVQLAAFNSGGAWGDFRWYGQTLSQDAMQPAGQAIAIDGADPGSPYGDIHPRGKLPLAERLERLAAVVEYGFAGTIVIFIQTFFDRFSIRRYFSV
jgi:hypothetical protein